MGHYHEKKRRTNVRSTRLARHHCKSIKEKGFIARKSLFIPRMKFTCFTTIADLFWNRLWRGRFVKSKRRKNPYDSSVSPPLCPISKTSPRFCASIHRRACSSSTTAFDPSPWSKPSLELRKRKR